MSQTDDRDGRGMRMEKAVLDDNELLLVIDRIVKRTFQMDFHWDWPAGVAFYGVCGAFETTGNEEYLRQLRGWVDARLNEGLPPLSVNAVSLGHSLLSLHEATGEERYIATAERLAHFLSEEAARFGEGVIQHTVSEGYVFPRQAWVDTMMMAGYFLLRIGKRLNRSDYFEDGLRQYHAHENLLQNESTNLYYHGWDDLAGNHMSGVYWARGNAWAALTMAKAIPLIPVQHPSFMLVNDSLRDQLAALARLQSDNGLWHTVLDDDASYWEASGSAGIATALLARGTLYRTQAQLALTGILACIEEDGSVKNVSAGTAVMNDREGYRNVPYKRIQGWGQGLTLRFLSDALEAHRSGLL